MIKTLTYVGVFYYAKKGGMTYNSRRTRDNCYCKGRRSIKRIYKNNTNN